MAVVRLPIGSLYTRLFFRAAPASEFNARFKSYLQPESFAVGVSSYNSKSLELHQAQRLRNSRYGCSEAAYRPVPVSLYAGLLFWATLTRPDPNLNLRPESSFAVAAKP